MRTSCLILFILVTQTLVAQDNEKKQIFNWDRTGIFAGYGYHMSDYSEVNKLLSDSGYATFKNNHFALNWGFTGRSEKVIFQLDFYKYTECVEAETDTCSHINFSSFGFSFGYNLLKNKKHQLFPMLGFYRNKTEMLITDYKIPDQSFNGYFSGYRNVSQVIRFNYAVNLALGYDYFIPIGKKYKTECSMGIRAGYYLQTSEGYFYVHDGKDVKLSNAPKINPAGGYVRIVGGLHF